METVIRFFKPYYDKNDAGHKIDHPLDVFMTAIDIDMTIKLRISSDEILAASFIHDMFVHLGRKDHHELAYAFAKSEDYPGKLELSPEAQIRVARAVLEHRASYTGDFYSPLSELISSADRGKPDFSKHIERALKNRSDRGEADPLAGAIAHIKEKYGTGGYARYPEMYLKVYGELLDQQRSMLDKMITT